MGHRDHLRRELAERVAGHPTMHRRRFLGLVAAGTGTWALAACSGDSSDAGGSGGTSTSTSTSTSTTAASATTAQTTGTTEPLAVPGDQGLTADPFTLGLASGDPLPDSVVLWTRLAPTLLAPDGAGGMPGTDVEVLWEVASDEAFDQVVASGIEVAVADFAHSVHAQPSGLGPDTWYWYRFRVGSFTSPVARTRTMPADDAEVDELRLAFASCQLRSGGRWTAYEHLIADEPDLVFFLGDYVYEYLGGEGVDPAQEGEVADLADYRVLYAAYKRDPKLQAAHHAAPWVVTWDDHEVENNYAGDVPQDEADRAAFADRRRAAYQAFWEHHPVRLDPPAADGSLAIYRTLRFGSLATFVVLDGRQYRSDQVCGDQIPTDPAACSALGAESDTMLGEEQEAWAVDQLVGADTTWRVLAQQTVMKALVLGDLVLNVDQWDGYPAARARLLTAIDDNGLENVVVLTGDIHAAGAADIRTPDAGATGTIVAHELVAPGISSQGLGAGVADAIDFAALGIPYANFACNGYVRCTVTPQRWQAEFVIVDTVEQDTSPITVDAAFTITAGTPGLVET